jgi:hypothetical protein
MLTEDERRIMHDLNERIQREPDSEKLVKLVEQLNRLLESAELRTRALMDGKGDGSEKPPR